MEILQGKISSLEDELNSISKEEVGENMGPIMEVKSCRVIIFMSVCLLLVQLICWSLVFREKYLKLK